MTSIWDLAEGAFGRGKVRAEWRAELESWERLYPPEMLEEAFSRAKDRKAKNLKYVETTLRGMAEERPAPQTEAGREKLRCDECGLPTWADSMTTREGRGLCRECARGASRGLQGWRLTLAGETFYTPQPTTTGRRVLDYWASKERQEVLA